MQGREHLPVLLVGASGRVGQMVAHHWRKDDMPLMSQFRRSVDLNGVLIWDPLLGLDALLDRASETGGFRAMVMLAGVTPGPGKDLDLNEALAEACLSAAEQTGIKRVLLASSSAVYGSGSAISETAACAPLNDYGAAKLRMEQSSYPWRKRGIDLCLLRIGNVAGADSLLQNVAKAAPDQLIEIDIFDDGRGPVRSYIGGRTLAEVLQSLCLHPAPLPVVLNIATPLPVSMDSLADAAGQPWRGRVPAGLSQQTITLDCSLLASIYNFSPQESGPSDMVQQWKETSKI